MKATQAWEQHIQPGKASEVRARFFNPKGWTEELYDMQNDPDSVHNLIESLKHQQTASVLRKELRRKLIEFYEAGLIPESKMVKRAADAGVTIYAYVRDPKHYDVAALLDAADLALAKEKTNLPELGERLKSPDAEIRYWAAVGCFLLNDASSVSQCVKNESHEVRAIAAWTLINSGDKDVGLQCLTNLLEQESYASLTVLNIIDWLGDEGQILLPP